MLRNKWSLAALILAPILLSAVVSSAMSGLMSSYEAAKAFSVGYSMESGSFAEDYIEDIVKAGKEADITFIEYPQGESESIITNNNLAGFVEFGTDEYIIHSVDNHEIEELTLEYFLGRVMTNSKNTVLGVQNKEITLPKTELEFLPAINSSDYYGIVYIVYCGTLGLLCATGVLAAEKKHGIVRKYRIAGFSNFQIYLSRIIPIVLVTAIGIGISAVCSAFMFEFHWGRPLLSAFILLAMICGSSALGLMFYGLFDNLAASIIPLWLIMMTSGIIGGTFETYMYSSIAENIKQLSPLYHINRALVELSCMGKSDYAQSAIVYWLSIFAVCSLVAVAAETVKRRVKA